MTVTIIQPDAAAGKDALLYALQATTNYGTLAYSIAGKFGAQATNYGRTALAVDLSTIPAGDIIDAVDLELWEYEAGSAGTAPASWPVDVRRILVDWVESQATWNRYKTNTDWPGSAGCSTDGTDRVATASASLTMDNDDADAFVTWSGAGLVADVQGWLDGDFANYGWLLSAETVEGLGLNNTAYNRFYMSDHTTAGQRPRVTITHHTPIGGAPIHLLRTHYYPEGVVINGS
jgi:hypothetical protein